jgi:hypothetical protein
MVFEKSITQQQAGVDSFTATGTKTRAGQGVTYSCICQSSPFGYPGLVPSAYCFQLSGKDMLTN